MESVKSDKVVELSQKINAILAGESYSLAIEALEYCTENIGSISVVGGVPKESELMVNATTSLKEYLANKSDLITCITSVKLVDGVPEIITTKVS